MNVYVMTADIDCPAHHALMQEAVPHQVLINKGKYGYGRNFANLWNRGEPFISIEHDIVPWPGAVQGLIDCHGAWCTYRFPSEQPYGNMPYGFGIGRYRPEGTAPKSWRKTTWNMLDGVVVPILNERLGAQPHVHEPPCAHARARVDSDETMQAS